MSSSRHSREDPPVSSFETTRNRLDSWKQIAAYLGRSEKTVRRWEETAGLPVHRLNHEKRPSVYAYTNELERWLETRKPAVEAERDIAAEAAEPNTEAPLPRLEPDNKTSRPGKERRSWLTACVIAAIFGLGLLAGGNWGRLRHRSRPPTGPVRIESLAVLPFKNMSSSPEQEYFADGITDELITELARTSSVRVISRRSVMRYKETTKSVSEITKDLEVDALVEGAVVRSGGRLRLSVQLVTASPERHLWADSYEGDIRDVLELQRKVAHDVRSKIGAKLIAAASSRPEKRLDAETYELYLRARHFLAKRNTEAMKKALAFFQEVLHRDPEYAPAYAGLALTYDVLGSYEVLAPQETFPNASSFASRALQLDNSLAEAYTARAIAASFWEFNWSAAEQDFQRAMTLDPSSEVAHHFHAEHLLNIDKPDLALGEMQRARELDPVSPIVNAALGRVYRDAHRYPEAVEQCRKTVDLEPGMPMGHWCLGQVYIGEHRYEAAIQELELANTLGKTPLSLRDLAWVYAAVGNKAKANALLDGLMPKGQSDYISLYSIGVIRAALGEADEAFRYLNRAFAERDCQITYLALDPELDPLRSDIRFQRLLEQLHIPR